MRAAREKWRKDQAALEGGKLVFLDETGVATNLTRRYGHSQKGKRCVDKVPHGHWQTSTFIAALRADGLSAPWLLDGPMNGQAFLEYVHHVLSPTLQPGDLVIADNLSSHKVAGVREAIEARGVCLLFLPACSPDLNPTLKLLHQAQSPSAKSRPTKLRRTPSPHRPHPRLPLCSGMLQLLPRSWLCYLLNRKCSRRGGIACGMAGWGGGLE